MPKTFISFTLLVANVLVLLTGAHVCVYTPGRGAMVLVQSVTRSAVIEINQPSAHPRRLPLEVGGLSDWW